MRTGKYARPHLFVEQSRSRACLLGSYENHTDDKRGVLRSLPGSSENESGLVGRRTSDTGGGENAERTRGELLSGSKSGGGVHKGEDPVS